MDYKKLVSSLTTKENTLNNALIAFISGGVIGAISHILVSIFNVETMIIIWIFLSSILTGIGLFDKLIEVFKFGLIIPITGFSHSVTSAMMEYKKEGFITGIGSNYFRLAGSVILYGIISSSILIIIRGIICLLSI
jgi:stage V sporulation protein AC